MKKHSMPEMKEGGVNVTPLIDVVMCLIVFFMLVAKIGVKTGASKLDLPTTVLGKKIDQLGDAIILNVTDPNIDREPDGTTPKRDPAGDPNGRIVKLNTNFLEPRVTARFRDNDPDAIDVPLIRRVSGNASYPLREELKKAVEFRKGKDKANGTHTMDDFGIEIRAEKGLQYSMLQQVLIECANAGIKKIYYGTLIKNGSAKGS